MSRSILIVEDTRTVAALLRIYLLEWGLEVRVAHRGDEGLRMALERPPDLLLSDVQMPEMDGFALCAAVRAHASLHQVPVVLLTALEDDDSRRHGRLVGATAFLTKPISRAALRAQVASLLPLVRAPARPASGT